MDAERNGEEWSPQLRRLYTDVCRSCKRGLSPPKQAKPLPFERLGELPADPRPWVPGGLVGGRNAIVAGAWWMMREMELSTLRASLVSLSSGPPPTAKVELPATKADLGALGVARAHGCICLDGPPQPACPVHAVWDQVILLQALFPHRRGDPP